MNIPKQIEFNNNHSHSIEIIYKALNNYRDENIKSAYYYDMYGVKHTTDAFFDSKDADKIIDYIENQYDKEQESKEINYDPYSYEAAVKNMEVQRNEELKRLQTLKGANR